MSQSTLNKLEQALKRLFDGEPVRTVSDGKINLSRINDEAGLSVGGIYYEAYEDFVITAKKQIAKHNLVSKKNQDDEVFEKEITEIDKIKDKLKNALRLKNKYWQDFKNQKILNNGVVAQNVSLAFRVNELEQEILETSSGKVTRLQRK